MFSQQIASLPRFIDPITSLIASHLQNALRLQRETANSNTTAELEVRLGSFVPSRRLRLPALPGHVSTASALDEADRHLYTFNPGLSAERLEKLLTDLVSVGIASPKALTTPSQDSLILHSQGGARFHFRIVEQPSKPTSSEKADTGVADHLFGFVRVSAPGDESQQRMRFLSSVRLLTHQERFVEWERTTLKTSYGLRRANVLCPEWGSDMRFSLATEEAPSASPLLSLSEPPALVLARWQRRLFIPVRPYFRLEVSAERSGADVLKYETLLAEVAAAAAVATPKGAGSPLRFPLPFVYMANMGFHTEVEVLLPELLKDWKRYHGAAVVSAAVPKNALGETASMSASPKTVSDPFLLQVAQDLLTLLQFLAAKR